MKIIIFIILSSSTFFLPSVYSLECQYCSTSEYDSDCREGTVKDLKTCTIKGEDHCYVEYIINEGSKPLYRRGCAPGDWCQQQVENHDVALKFCNTCQGSNCNTDPIGSKDPSSFLCRSCNSTSFTSDCRKGTINTYDECEKGAMCIQYYAKTSQRHIWKRECGDSNSCTKLEKQYKHSLKKCKNCEYELCNNYPMPVYL